MQQSGATAFAIQEADGVGEEEIPEIIMTHQNLTDDPVTQQNLEEEEGEAASVAATAPTSDFVSSVHIQASTGGFRM